ncbi:hypothetical protein T07_8606 [Trichinella nelsoni]|uniref:Uncharacterized protein n=1 Tax=Trichinella nelsoni TaxID=6336 RepID=A0A0V0RB41_9BILA|nr:hypothetical protein T07_8606 [Trichinella nelsoni]
MKGQAVQHNESILEGVDTGFKDSGWASQHWVGGGWVEDGV